MHRFILALGLSLCAFAAMADTFVVSDIRVRGLQRVSAGTVFSNLPLNVGERVDEARIGQLIRALFKSEFFEDVQISREGNVLVVTVAERPTVDKIEIKGNKAIQTDKLLEGLKKQGFAVGEIFKRATLERMQTELQRQYVAQGKYGAKIKAEAASLPRNRVSVKVDVVEGKNAEIRHLNIVGNLVFPTKTLVEEFELKLPDLFSFYTGSDKYSREKLQGDIDKLQSYYQDRGYVDFKVDSTQVSVTPDKREVYITINMTEGKKFKVRKVDLVGDLGDVNPVPLRKLLLVKPDAVFSRELLTATEDSLKNALGNAGYTFANATGVPDTNEDGTVDVRFIVETGKRAYVHRLTFRGNTLTQDEVLRREMRQLEGGWASTSQIDLSKLRLERLGFFKEVNVETPKLPGSDDQVDVDFTVEEQPSAAISATLGFAQGSGLLLGANYQNSNNFGSGNSVSVGVNWSQFQKSLNLNYFDPYYTIDGVSRGFNVFYRRSDFQRQNLTSFSTDSFGGGVNFAFPVGETEQLGFGLGIEHTAIKPGSFPVREISDYLKREGKNAFTYKATGSWSSSTLNRGLFATAGISQQLGAEIALPGSTVAFFKLSYNAQMFVPVAENWTVRFHTELGYGDGYLGNSELPFFDNYFAGGFGSVRGFKSNTLGPHSTPGPISFSRNRQGDPFGGNLLVVGGAELLFPLPFVKDRRAVRPALFYDFGNVFNTKCPRFSIRCDSVRFDELRYSIGIGVTWLSGLGPLTFAISHPFNSDEFDNKEVFQFELGQSF